MSRNRKDDHIRLAKQQQDERTAHAGNDFDAVEILYHALDAIDPAQVELATPLGPWQLCAPFYINGMTGGTQTAETINRTLAIAAAATGIPMASGSVGLAIDEPDTKKSFTVIREENPDGIVWANIGAGRPVEHAHEAVDLLEADALQIHVNAVQETVMPEGSREFSHWLKLIEKIVAALERDGVPVIIKEVGFGLSARTLQRLREVGVSIADVAGSGGTNFALIENARRSGADSWDYLAAPGAIGSSAVRCLLDAYAAGIIGDPSFTVLASGGVRHPLDVVRALALGARAVGVAGTFLKVAMDSGPEVLTETIETWKKRITQLLVLYGATSPADLAVRSDLLLSGAPAEFARIRGLDLGLLANRSSNLH